MLTRRAALAALAAGAAFAPSRLEAAAFPSRPITIVVPYPPGGPVDLVARLLAQATAGAFGQPVSVDNRAGGSGVIGTAAVARAEPDGHTVVLGTNQTHATNASLVKNISYDAVRDFTPVAAIADIPHVLVVRKGLAVTTVGELVGLAKARPGTLNYGSTGIGSASHLAAELFKTRAEVDIQHVPFRGAAPMVQELIAGRLDLAFATLPSVVGQIAAGEIAALGVASPRRAQALSAVPTLAEAGVAGVEADAWFALFAPAQTPAAAVERWYAALEGAVQVESVRAGLAQAGVTLALRPPQDVAAWLPGEVSKWAAVVRAANVSLE